MIDLVAQGGLLMGPIIICSIVAAAIVGERFWSLRRQKIIPPQLTVTVWKWIKNNQMDAVKLKEIKAGSPLGRILAAGMVNSKHGRDVMKEAIMEVATHEVHALERYLTALGTIAAITPLLGLLGPVLGMIDVFGQIVLQGTGSATILAGGISKALVTTATGLMVAIPALFFHRYFERLIEELTITMEQEAIRLVDVIAGEREG
ncbi:MAG: MotA/TolQ/ExbB proton channel family protein [Gammaproteobacteria bacterium]